MDDDALKMEMGGNLAKDLPWSSMLVSSGEWRKDGLVFKAYDWD